jgi:hypothetical protein
MNRQLEIDWIELDAAADLPLFMGGRFQPDFTVRRAWKGYRSEVLDALEKKSLI